MNLKKLVCLTTPLLMLVACTDAEHNGYRKGKETTTIEVNKIITDSNLTDEEKAETLALAAEQLLGSNPQAFMFADEVFNSALKADRKNIRAQFYKYLLAPQMLMKGIHTRTSKLAQSTRTTSVNHAEVLAEAKEKLAQSSVDFIIDGKPDINTEADIQKLIDDIADTYEGMRKFLKNNRGMELTLNVPSSYIPHLVERSNVDQASFYNIKKACFSERLNNGDVNYRSCTNKEVSERKLELADIEVLQNAYAGAQVGLILANSYRADGSIELAVTQDRLGNRKMGTAAQYEYLAKTSEFATNRTNLSFKVIQDMGADGLKGVRYIQANQKTLCKEKGYASWWMDVATRPGKLFDKGICSDVAESTLAKVEAALAGESHEVSFDSDFDYVKDTTVQINPAAFLTNQIQDLKTLNPEFNGCGSVIAVEDDKLGGLFVNGGANQYLFAKQKTWCSDFYDWYQKNEHRF